MSKELEVKVKEDFNIKRLVRSLGFNEFSTNKESCDLIFRHNKGYSVQISYKDNNKKDIDYILLQEVNEKVAKKIRLFNKVFRRILDNFCNSDKYIISLYNIQFGGYIKTDCKFTSVRETMEEFKRIGWKTE